MINKELLNYAIEHGMLDIGVIQQQIEMAEREKILKQHNNRIWKGADNRYRTYIQDGERRKLVCKRSKKDLEDELKKFR